MVTGYSWIAWVKGLMKAQPGSSAPAVTMAGLVEDDADVARVDAAPGRKDQDEQPQRQHDGKRQDDQAPRQ